MKNFRFVVFAVLMTVGLFSMVTYTACKKDKCLNMGCLNGGACVDGTCMCPAGYEGLNCETKTDPCKNVTCKNGGVCADGKCSCPPGYEGTNCETLSKDKFIGNYKGTSSCNGNEYIVTLSQHNSNVMINLSNVDGYEFSSDTYLGMMEGSNSFSFSNTSSSYNTGMGILANGQLTLTYTQSSSSCVFVGTKQ
jgi:hypothetical protein